MWRFTNINNPFSLGFERKRRILQQKKILFLVKFVLFFNINWVFMFEKHQLQSKLLIKTTHIEGPRAEILKDSMEESQ